MRARRSFQAKHYAVVRFGIDSLPAPPRALFSLAMPLSSSSAASLSKSASGHAVHASVRVDIPIQSRRCVLRTLRRKWAPPAPPAPTASTPLEKNEWSVGGRYTYRDGKGGGSGRYCTLPRRESSLNTCSPNHMACFVQRGLSSTRQMEHARILLGCT